MNKHHCNQCKKAMTGYMVDQEAFDCGRFAGPATKTEITYCPDFPDGTPDNFADCLSMPDMCKACDNKTGCHIIDGIPTLDTEAVAVCRQEQEEEKKFREDILNIAVFGRKTV